MPHPHLVTSFIEEMTPDNATEEVKEIYMGVGTHWGVDFEKEMMLPTLMIAASLSEEKIQKAREQFLGYLQCVAILVADENDVNYVAFDQAFDQTFAKVQAGRDDECQ